jgi:nucleoside-diphosphate-sugar epimerase
MDKIKSVALTGATGFLGSHVLKRLVIEGFKPIIIVRRSSNFWRITDLLSSCTILILNDNFDNVEELFNANPVDCLIHLATDYGRNKSLTNLINTNVLFPISLIEAGSKSHLKLFINTDSFFAKHHFNQQYLKEHTASKRILENLLVNFCENVNIANLRIEHVYGENDSDEKFFNSIIRKLLNGEESIPLTAGTQRRDFIYANDVASAYFLIINNYQMLNRCEEFEIGTGQSIMVKDFVQKMASEIGGSSYLDFGALEARPGDISDSFAKTSKLKEMGWKPSFTTEQALKQIIKNEKKRFNK